MLYVRRGEPDAFGLAMSSDTLPNVAMSPSP